MIVTRNRERPASGDGGRDDQKQPADGTEHSDAALVARFPWLTPRRILFGTIGWIAAFAVGSIAIANPFFTERSAAASINTWNVMYLHGVFIGMVGVALLLAALLFRLRWRHLWLLICLGAVAATLLASVGGIFDRHVPGPAGDQVAMWTQILGFFCLDEMLVVLLLGFVKDWRARTPGSRRLSFITASAATGSMLIAAIMGHLAGWIMDYGDTPRAIGSFARFEGESVSTLTANLIGSHSHEMVVAFMVLAVTACVAFFAERTSAAPFLLLRRIGLAMALAGTVGFTVMYVAAGFTSWVIPAMFSSGPNGVAADDLVTGLAMTGGLIALAGAALGRATRPLATALAAVWMWALTIALVVATGYWIEFHENQFGAGKHAPRAASDAIFTWFHQDVGLFLFPFMTLVLLATSRFVLPRYQGAIAWLAAAGGTVLYAGGMVYLFADQAIHGTGYVLSTIGLIGCGAAVLASIWWGLGGARVRSLARRRTRGSGAVPAAAARTRG
jgi:hypothetical protein